MFRKRYSNSERRKVIFLKKTTSLRFVILASVAFGFLVSNALYSMRGFSLFPRKRTQTQQTDNLSNADLIALSYRILVDIKNLDFAALSDVAHPELGVLFSPYATIDMSTNRTFNAREISKFSDDKNDYIWGINNTNGEPIKMTAIEYFAGYIFKKDYTTAPVIGINRIIRSGNAFDNITDIFPGIRYIEYHIPGDRLNSVDDTGWSTLRLGFEEYHGSLWLVVIIHSEW